MRKKTREIKLGSLTIGGDSPVSVQSMTNTDTRDVQATAAQILRLEEAGCEIARVAVVDESAAEAIKEIKKLISIPLIADIHFDHRLALKSVESGADGIRINPGNIGGDEKVREVLDACSNAGCAVRIGVNAGSLEKELLKKYGVTPKALAESAARHARFFEEYGFKNYKVSLKASSVPMTLESYKIFAEEFDCPLHIGITEAGTIFSGTVKSAVGIGALLSHGLGDTLRVSLTGDPVKEVHAAWEILKSMELRQRGPEIISCPTCGRTEIELIDLAEKVEEALAKFKSHVSVAVMGCVVNGPGEAREADYGIAGGRGNGIIFKKGQVVKKVTEESLLEEFIDILKKDGIN